eukprot:708171_1
MMIDIYIFLCFIGSIHQGQCTHCKHLGPGGFGGATVDLSAFRIVEDPYDTNNGKKKDKRQQFCKDIPIFDAFIVVESNNDLSNPVAVHGRVYDCSEFDSLGTIPSITAEDAVKAVIDPEDVDNINAQQVTLTIYIEHDDEDTARLVWVITVASFVDIYSWWSIVDAMDGSIYQKIDKMQQFTVTETGGNEKIGPMHYTFDLPQLSLRNDKVIVSKWHAHTPTNESTMDDYWSELWSNLWSKDAINCTAEGEDCVNDAVNGGYGPAGDAFQFGNEAVELFNEWAWGLDPLAPQFMPMHLFVHMYEDNAFYWGGILVFGDGVTYGYPFTTRDVVGHEAAHGFTDYHSNLIYSAESGAMNEAYSDLAGQALNVYANGYTNWTPGEDFTKPSYESIARKMYDPRMREWKAIANYSDINVHRSSGIYNNMFYLLSAYGWSVKDIFQVATKANIIYWAPNSTMHEGACDMIDAAVDLFGEDQDRIYNLRTAFRTVGIECDDLNIVLEEDSLSAKQGDILDYVYQNDDDRLLRFAVDEGGVGEFVFVVKFGSQPAADGTDADCVLTVIGLVECTFDQPSQIGTWYVRIVANSDFSGVSFAIEKPPVDVHTCQEQLSSLETDWIASDVHHPGPDWTINSDDNTWTSNCDAPAWRRTTFHFASNIGSDACNYDDLITISGKAQGPSTRYVLQVAFQNEEGVTVASDSISDVDLSDTAQEYSLTYDNKRGLAVQVTVTEHAGAGTILTAPVITIPLSCAFSPRDEEAAWQVSSTGDDWLVNRVDKTWTAQSGLSTRNITVSLSQFCPLDPYPDGYPEHVQDEIDHFVMSTQYITVFGRVSSNEFTGEYHLQVEFKNGWGTVIATKDTGVVTTINGVQEHSVSYEPESWHYGLREDTGNHESNEISLVTITETVQYFGILEMPIIRISDRDDTPFDPTASARHVRINTDSGYDPMKPEVGTKITTPNTVMDRIKNPFVRDDEEHWNDFKLLDAKMTYIMYILVAMLGLMIFAVCYGMCCGFNVNPPRFTRRKKYSVFEDESDV